MHHRTKGSLRTPKRGSVAGDGKNVDAPSSAREAGEEGLVGKHNSSEKGKNVRGVVRRSPDDP